MRPSVRKSHQMRRGAVAVEFAVVAPIFLAIVMGVLEVGRVVDAQNLLETAAREGARLGAMDRTGMIPAGQTSNDKLIADVKGFLEAQGVPADHINVQVTHPDSGATFDLDDPANELELFQVRVDVPFSAVSHTTVSGASDYTLSADVTFRNGRATIAE